MEENVIIPEEVDNRITVGKAALDYSKVITGGNEPLDVEAPTEEKPLTDEEKRELKLAELKKFIHRSAPKKEYGVRYKQNRQKKNKTSGKSRAKNR